MKGMASAVEFPPAAPPGKYTSRLVGIEAGPSKKGDSMLTITAEIIAPQAYAGQQATDYVGTDGTTKFGAMSKGKLRGLVGDAAVSTDAEVPDAIIAQQLLNRVYDIEYGNEPWMSESVKGSGNYDTPATQILSNGQTIVRQKLVVKNYHPASAQAGVAPQQLTGLGQAIPQQGGQQFAPQGYAPQTAQPQYAPQPGQQFAPQGFNVQPAAPQYAPQPQQYAQPPYQQQLAPQAQQGFAPQGNLPPGGFAPQQGPMPWQQPGGLPPNGAVAQGQPAAEPAKRGRKLKGEAGGEAEG